MISLKLKIKLRKNKTKTKIKIKKLQSIYENKILHSTNLNNISHYKTISFLRKHINLL